MNIVHPNILCGRPLNLSAPVIKGDPLKIVYKVQSLQSPQMLYRSKGRWRCYAVLIHWTRSTTTQNILILLTSLNKSFHHLGRISVVCDALRHKVTALSVAVVALGTCHWPSSPPPGLANCKVGCWGVYNCNTNANRLKHFFKIRI